jgi:sugar phosphate isomerase/epimerase
MQLSLPGRPHLTYCTNIHSGESWPEIERALHRFLPSIKQRISPDRPMGVGLRLSARAAFELQASDALSRLKEFLAAGGFYIFTVNAFPYGTFHGQPVKEQVYAPDWREPERLAFTICVADLLAEILPVGLEGSISTVPGAFRANVTGRRDIDVIVEALVRCAAHLQGIATERGRTIALAIEPEPACFIETTAEAIAFFEEHLFSAASRTLFAQLTGATAASAEAGLRRHLGLCFDVCHSAVEFEDTRATLDAVRAAGIKIPKLQLSSALSIACTGPEIASVLSGFDDGVYLHQTVERRDGAITRYTDLPEALAALRRDGGGGEWRVHCHVPVFQERFENLRSTQGNLREALALCREREVSAHLEVETYTWNVLPADTRNGDLGDDIVRELQWVRTELGA